MHTFGDFVNVLEASSTLDAINIGEGLYTYRPLNPASLKMMLGWARYSNIPNPVPPEKMHVTVIYSVSEVPRYEVDREVVIVRSETYRILRLKDALVLAFHAPELESQWYQAQELGARMTFPTYIPHVTLSYQYPESFDISVLKPPLEHLVLEPEEAEPLDADWAKKLNLEETAPPSKKIQKWIEDPDVRSSFKDRYGNEWAKVLYATAWCKYRDGR